jgi:hypothetical protein
MKGLGQTLYGQRNGKEKFIHYGRYENGVYHGRGTVAMYESEEDFESNEAKIIHGRWNNGRII